MSAPSTDSRSILVVDDEEGVLAAIQSILEPENYEVVATSNPLKEFDDMLPGLRTDRHLGTCARRRCGY